MWLQYSNDNDLKRVPDGKQEIARCGSCGKVATFYESEVTKSFNLYVVIPLWKEKTRVMQCGECLAACSREDFEEVQGKKADADSKSKTSDHGASAGQSFQHAADFGMGFLKMTDSLGHAAKGVMGMIDQMTFKMLVDNLKAGDQQVVMDTIEQLEKEKRPLSVPPLYFVSQNHPNKRVRERAAKAVAGMVDPVKLQKLTAGKSSEEATKALIEEYGHYKSK